MEKQWVVGVDLGGTNVRAAVVDVSGQIVGQRIERPSCAQEGTAAILESLASAVSVAAKGCPEVARVGLAVPGHVDDEAGLARWAPNFGEFVNGVFHYWKDVPLKLELESRTGLKVVMGNDANCAALGEYLHGSGKGTARCLVLLTVGTGIGGGVILGPSAVHGQARGPLMLLGGNKGGAELGHVTISHNGLDCNAGTYGALEAYCQRDAIVKRAQHKLRRGRESIITSLVNGDLSIIDPKVLTEAADLGDELAIEVWREIGAFLGTAVGSFINLFAPDIVAIGGQISKAGQWLLGPAIEEARNVAIPSLFGDSKILQAEQTEDAGILGAAALARQQLQGLEQ